MEQLNYTFLAGCETLAKAIDKRWHFLDSEQREGIKHINKKIWKLSSNVENKESEIDFSVYTIIQASREVAGFVLWRIQELEQEKPIITKDDDDFDVWYMDESDDEEYQRVKEYIESI